ncbi:hypothetical protein [Sporomusa sp.]|uniref:hypothetical protein n=1 Tax=Sporomusa sp. TaxID=2078658 RepID=UPI002BA8038B|nr:hypothetical protein [Sporomusa sp.]HWR42982.1 hypothetical protein [Sporomusa sp.]
MSDSYKVYDEQYEYSNSGTGKDSNEVIIIIRDGKVITFIQKSRNALFEGMHGDGI